MISPPFNTLLQLDTIDKLLRFLERELQWPITAENVDDVTFQYEPEELGLKPEHAPKINAIYQIRPPTRDTPWGIFFIDFENKKLPVTLMRRILNHLRVKKKHDPSAQPESGNQGGLGWNAADLLFMTTYGQEAEGMREVAFAHFHHEAGDLPTLNVLQWDAQDTPAKLGQTYDALRENLGWPPDTEDKQAWRNQWSKPFRHGIGHTIKTSKGLAEKLAELSKNIRSRVSEVLGAETEKGPMTKLYKAFQSALIHDLKEADFADTFAQTVTYGLFSAAVSRRYPEDKGTKSLTTETIAEIVPETNPFLREVLATFLDVGGRKKGGIDFDELGVQEVVELLRSDETDMRAILEDFGNRKQGEDPVIHFYEDYLKAYNKELKVKRGVFYTPQPVVSYIVRSVHELLQSEFGLEDGLASTITWGEMTAKNPDVKLPEGTSPDEPFVVVLDPATGTATFLVEVIDVIYKHLQKKWNDNRAGCIALLRQPTANRQPPTSFQDFWNAYVPDHLLPRLYGYELMMAPYAIAHMKVGLKLGETGYNFASNQRVRIYLTNALEPASELQARLALDWEALAHEAMAVKAVKETQRFTVVIGNPPYSGHSANASKDEKGNRNFIGNLVHDYYFVDGAPLGEKNPKWLQDDYVKFLRFGQYLIQQTGIGALGMITNHGYLDNPTFRGMRGSLMRSFDDLRFLDLHGNAKKKEVAPDGSKDENVFDIMQGVAVCLLTKAQASITAIRCGQLYGSRDLKYVMLTTPRANADWACVSPTKPYYPFVPKEYVLDEEYRGGVSISEAFRRTLMGPNSHRDDFAIAFRLEEALERIQDLRDSSMSDPVLRHKYALEDSSGWSLANARKSVASTAQPVPCLYRPFDFRFMLFGSYAFDRLRPELSDALLRGSLGLISTRQTQEAFAVFVTNRPVGQHKLATPYDGSYVSPLYMPSCEKELAIWISEKPNLSPGFLHELTRAVGRRFELGRSASADNGLFAHGETLVAPKQPTLGAFGEGLSPLQGSLITAPDPAIHPSGPSFSPEDVFHYIYAVLHSPTYRSRYAEFLKIDFPRIPLPGGSEVFDALVPLGAELVALHLMESPRLDQRLTTFTGPTDPRVEKVSFTLNPQSSTLNPPTGTVWIDKAQTTGFRGVPEEVWNFHIGGYQVCEKWLKDRGPKKGNPGRILSPEDIDHYHHIVVALNETIRLMTQIDQAIETHGGWPGAFQGAAGQ